ncbi:MAG TPA: Crp/Fnr family transcriptional regulator [Puia sp.]
MHKPFIDHVLRFISLTAAERQLITAKIPSLAVRKKDFLLRAGQICTRRFFVEKGCLRQFFINKKGEETIIQFAIENWWISDYMSLTDHTAAHFSIQAVEDSSVLVLDDDHYESLLRACPKMEKYFRIVLQKAYAAAQFKFRLMHDFSKEERYRFFNKHFPEFVQRVPQYMLASFLNITPEYMSKIRSQHLSIS